MWKSRHASISKWILTAVCHSTNLIIILVMMQVSKKIPFEDENVLMGVRALYVVSNLLIAGVYFYTKMQIDKKRGTSRTHDGREMYKRACLLNHDSAQT